MYAANTPTPPADLPHTDEQKLAAALENVAHLTRTLTANLGAAIEGPVSLLQSLSAATRMSGSETSVRGEPTENVCTIHFATPEDLRRFYGLARVILVNSKPPATSATPKPTGSPIDDLLAPLDAQGPPADWHPPAEGMRPGMSE